MMRKSLTSNVHLYTAQMDRMPVVVLVADEVIGNGIIDSITESSVRIGGEWFLRG